jgi:hypothetical protein
MLHFLLLIRPYAPLADPDRRDIVSVSLREGVDFLDDLAADFGPDFYILETAEDR